jgi:hypothetical protein
MFALEQVIWRRRNFISYAIHWAGKAEKMHGHSLQNSEIYSTAKIDSSISFFFAHSSNHPIVQCSAQSH